MLGVYYEPSAKVLMGIWEGVCQGDVALVSMIDLGTRIRMASGLGMEAVF